MSDASRAASACHHPVHSAGDPWCRRFDEEARDANIQAAPAAAIEAGVLLWTGSDDGLVHLSRDNDQSWANVTPPDVLEPALISTIEPSPHDAAIKPYLLKTTDFGATWTPIVNEIPADDFTRVIRADPVTPGLLFVGTETGVYASSTDQATLEASLRRLDVPFIRAPTQRRAMLPTLQARHCGARSAAPAVRRQEHGPRLSTASERNAYHGSAVIGPIPLPETGQKVSGYFTFDDPLLATYEWPYFAVVGTRPGLKFLLTAGIHAAEYTGMIAAIRLGRMLQPEHVAGTLVIIPVLNQPGFFERSVYVNPEDGQNLNRAFPGSPDGTWSQRFAHHLLNDVVVHFDRAMDMHAGDMVEDLEPFLGYRATTDNEVDRKSREMIDAHGGARWVSVAAPSGERAGMLYGAAAERGVPAILAESGGRGLVEEDAVARHVDGVLNIWRHLGLLTDIPSAPVNRPSLLTRNEWLRSEHEGIFLCHVRPGQRVAEGEVLGEMIDLLGNHLSQITSPAAGLILFTVTSPAIKHNGLLLAVGVPERTA